MVWRTQKFFLAIFTPKHRDEKNDATLALINALESDEVKKFIEDKYEGAVVPMF